MTDQLVEAPEVEQQPRQRRRLGRRWIALIVAVVVLAAGVIGLLSLSSAAQRVVLEGEGSSIWGGVDNVGDSMAVALGSVANDSPWGISLVGAGTSTGSFTSDVRVGITREEPNSATEQDVEWFADGDPVALASGETGYLWFDVTPTATDPAGFASLGIQYRDDAGFEHSVSAGLGVLAAPEGLPEGIASFDSEMDSYGYSAFMSSLAEALDAGDPQLVAPFLGGDATVADAEDFIADQAGVGATFGYMSNEAGRHRVEVTFFETDSAKDARPTFIVSWAHNRWSAATA